MTAIFTNSVVEHLREIARSPADTRDFTSLMSVVDAAAGATDLAVLGGATRVSAGRNGDVFLVRKGNIRALLNVDPRAPDRIVVARVFRAESDEEDHDSIADAVEGPT